MKKATLDKLLKDGHITQAEYDTTIKEIEQNTKNELKLVEIDKKDAIAKELKTFVELGGNKDRFSAFQKIGGTSKNMKELLKEFPSLAKETKEVPKTDLGDITAMKKGTTETEETKDKTYEKQEDEMVVF